MIQYGKTMIQYRKADGSLGEFDSNTLYNIRVDGHTFTIIRKIYGWDDYDFWYDEIKDVTEIRI